MPWWQAFDTAWSWYSVNRDNLIPIGGLIGGTLVAWAALRQAGIAVRRHHAQTEADRGRRITESFSKAAEQLASDKIEARLGGIYTLERISRESASEYWPVMEILTAFIRERGRWREPDEHSAEELAKYYDHWRHPLDAEPRAHELPTDVASALSVILRRDKGNRDREKSQGWRLDLSGTDLREADLHKAHLEGAKFSNAHLEGAQLWDAHLERADFWGAHLEVAHLERAHMEGADFTGTHLRRTLFDSADLRKAGFTYAKFEGTQFTGADVRDATFWPNSEGTINLGTVGTSGQAVVAKVGRIPWLLRNGRKVF